MEPNFYDPSSDLVKDRIQLIQLYGQANELRHSPQAFRQAVDKADDAMNSWLTKYGKTSRIME